MRREQLAIGRKRVSYLASDIPAAASRQPPLRTVVFLHAFPLTSDMWEPNVGALPEGWRGIAPDLRGFGACSPPDPGSRIIDFAGDVIDLLDRLEITEAVVVGCSMGGYVLFEMFHTAHQYVSAAVLVSTRAGADSEDGKAGRKKMIERLGTGGVEAIADEMLPKLLGETTQRERPDLVKHVRNLMLSSSQEAVKTAITALMERADSTPLLSRMKMPTLIVAGVEDTLIPPSQAEAMHKTIANSKYELIPSAGHLPNLEQTTSFDALLSQFLSQL